LRSDDFFRPSHADNLRRLHLAAQAGETLFFMMRPLAASTDSSPAPLRLSLTPARGGVNIGFVKRQGPVRDEPLFLPMHVGPVRHVVPQQRPVQMPIDTARPTANSTTVEMG
jgi:protein ImuA